MICAHLNVRSLLNNFAEFKCHVFKFDYHVLGVTESWLSPNIDNDNLSLDGYEFIRQDRTGMRRGGGVGIYVKSNLKYTVLKSECRQIIEHIWLRVEVQGQSIIVGNIYRPPNSNCQEFLNYFEDILIDFYANNDRILCFGDFNVNMLDNDASHVVQLNNILDTFNLCQMVSEPTRVSQFCSTLIDLICCNSNIVQDVGVRDVSISDHLLVYVKLNMITAETHNTQYLFRSLDRINLVQFQADLEGASWNSIYQIDDIDTKVEFLTTTILNVFNTHAPLKLKNNQKRPYSPWITDNIRFMKNLRNQALSRFRRTRDPIHWGYYKDLRNFTTTAIRAEKRAYLNQKFQNCSLKEKWAELRKLNVLKNKTKNIPNHLKNVDDLNIYFTQIAQNNNNPKPDLLNFYKNNLLHNQSFSFIQIDEELVCKVILDIKSKAFGADNLNITLISLCCPFIVPYIAHIINSCIGNSYFPRDWKLANVLPLAKVNNPTEFGQLRSISILPTFSKILEKVIELQIVSYVYRFNIIPPKQSGFRARYSCSTALSDIVDDVITSQDSGDATVLVLLDYTKAFDMIDHNIMVAILRYIGFVESASSLMFSFLSDRKQRVCLEGNKSDILVVKSGVPQGSILGPLLYSLYTFNIVRSLEYCQYHLYADDTQIYASFKPSLAATITDQINSDLDALLKVSEDHLLKINPSKSAAILFCHETYRYQLQETIKLKLGNNMISFHDSVKSLGLIMDCKLKFKEHITLCLKKAYSMLKLIYSHRYYLSQKTKSMLCDALVLSHFNFADHLYGPFLDSLDMKRVQKVQNSCLRLIFGIRRRERISHKLPELGWLNMAGRRALHSAVFFYKIIKFKCPPYLHQKIKYRTDVHNVNIRRLNLLSIPSHRTEKFKKSFSYQIASLLNRYKVVDFSLSAYSFKRKIKAMLLLNN